ALAALTLCACQIGGGVPGPDPSRIPTAPPTSPEPSGAVPGGFTSQDPKDPAIQAIFKEAEKLLQAKYPSAGLRLTNLKSAQSQVVAGANYKLEADYSDSKGTGMVTVTVFRNLQGAFSLSEDNYKG
ncbi:MAG: cystatin domain-containing protein, partial [Candidatus Sericytochromatia bacterium]